MRDQDERAGPAVQQVLHEGEHVGVQVVAGLVQDEHVGLLQDGEEQRQPALLTAREIFDATPHLLLREAQALEQLLGARLLPLHHHIALSAGEHLADRVVLDGLELVELLGEHAEAHRGPDLHAAATGAEFALDHVEQRGLTRAVLAQQAVAIAGADEPGDVREHGAVGYGARGAALGRALGRGLGGVTHIDIDHIDDLLAKAAHGKSLELELVADGRDVGDELAGGLDTELGFGAASLCAAGEPCEFLARHVAATLLGDRRHAVALHALQDIGGVPTLERVDAAVVHLPHGRTDLIQEPAVVRDHEHGAAPPLPTGFKVLGKPVDGPHVQMVGRLVEHENVIVADEQAREVHAAALPTRELAHQPLPGHIGDEAVQDLAHARAGRPFVLGQIAHHGPVHGRGFVQRVALTEHPYRHIATAGHPAVVGLDRAGEHSEQTRLAIAVFAHDPDAVTLIDTQGHVPGDKLGGKLEMHAVAAEQNGHINAPRLSLHSPSSYQPSILPSSADG